MNAINEIFVSKNKDILPHCPKCKSVLTYESSYAFCKLCNVKYPILGNIVVLTSPSELDASNSPLDMYEEQSPFKKSAYKNYPGIGGVLRRLIVRLGIVRMRMVFIDKAVNAMRDNKQKLKVLDIACGGGHDQLKEFGLVVGLDASLTSLKVAGESYDVTVQGNMFNIPYPDNTFDIVSCIDCIGHILPEDKDSFLLEVKRVLKSTGYLLACVETHSHSLLWEWCQSDHVLFEKLMVQRIGHIGYEYSNEFLGRLSKIAEYPLLVDWIPMIGTAGDYLFWLDNEYQKKSRFVSMWVQVCRIFHENRILEKIFDLSAGIIARTYKIFNDHRKGKLLMVFAKIKK